MKTILLFFALVKAVFTGTVCSPNITKLQCKRSSVACTFVNSKCVPLNSFAARKASSKRGSSVNCSKITTELECFENYQNCYFNQFTKKCLDQELLEMCAFVECKNSCTKRKHCSWISSKETCTYTDGALPSVVGVDHPKGAVSQIDGFLDESIGKQSEDVLPKKTILDEIEKTQ